jgi:hypothetical protein
LVAAWERLQALGPAAGAVIDAQDFQRVVANPIGDDGRRFRNDELPRSINTAGMTELRIFREKMLDAMKDVGRDAFGGDWVILSNIGAKGDEIVNALRDHWSVIPSVERDAPCGSPIGNAFTNAGVCNPFAALERGNRSLDALNLPLATLRYS